MSNVNFKKGDRVKSIRSIGIDEIVPIGTEGNITLVDNGDYKVKFDSDDRHSWWASDKDLEEVKVTTKITHETRLESLNGVYENIEDRYEICMTGLQELGQATANELAIFLYKKGCFPHFSRNFVHPRLNELIEHGKVEVVGKREDGVASRPCYVYQLKTKNAPTEIIKVSNPLIEEYKQGIRLLPSTFDKELVIKVLQILGQATANEVAMYMFKKGMVSHFDRHYAHAPLNVLDNEGKVEVIGKKLDSITDKNCAIYQVKH